MLELFLACDSAIEGVVFDLKGLGFVAKVASDLDRRVVALRCSGGREACGFCLAGVFL